MAATPVQPSITANITNAPTLTLTTTKTLTNSPAPVVNVFKNVNASGGGYNGVLDTGNNSIIKQIVIKVTGVINFPNEKLTIDGFDIPLLKTTVDGRFPTGGSLTNGSSYSVVQIGSVTTVTLKNLNLLTLGDTNQANALIESILYKNTDPTPTDGNRSIIMVSMTDGGVVGTSNNGYFGQNYTAFNPSLMTSTVTLDRTAPNAPVLSMPENEGVGVTNIEGQDGTSVVVSLAGTGAREGDVVTLTVKDLAPIKYTLQGLDIDSESVNLAISAATLTLLGSGSVPVNVTITDAAQNTSVVSAASMNLVNVNSAPSGASSTVIILEDNSRTFTASDFGFSDVVSDFFYGENSGANALSGVIITALPAMGTLTLNNVNVIQNQRIPAANLSDLKYTPALNGNGQSYASIGFKVQDNGGTANGGSDTSTENTLTINVTPVNDAPVFVNPIPNQMAVFNAPFEFTMPANIFTDVDSPALTYLATLDNGSVLPPWLNFDAATGRFTGMAKSTAGFNVKVTASDGALNVSNMFQIALAPMVTNVALTGATGSQNNRLNAGDVVSASVTFSESVNVTGLPQLALNIGGNTVKADYASGSGTSVLTFNYTILPSQHDTDGISIEANALSLNAGTIKDANGNHAVISIAQAMDNASYIVDNVTPLWLSSNPNDNGYLMDLAANLSLTFNEGVSKGTGTIQLYNAANTLVESFDVATSSRITGWNGKTLTIDPTANLTANTGYYVKIAPTAINDLAGNAYAGINDATTLNFSTAAADGSVAAGPSYVGAGNSYLGFTVSGAGDVNGDGFDDYLVGAHGTPSTFVVYGNASGLGVDLTGGTIAASKGFRISGGYSSGYSVSGVGDVNGDGLADVLVGTYTHTSGTAAYVVYGNSTGTNVVIDPSQNIASSLGFRISGGAGTYLGYTLSGAGDVNGDGLADLVVGAPGTGNMPVMYVVYGRAGSAGVNLASATIAASDGFKVTSPVGSGFSSQVSGAGDVNGDGLADVIVGANIIGSAFVIYGNSTGTAADVTSTTIAAGSGFKIVTAQGANSFGLSVSGAGDVNGDGLADVVVGDRVNNSVYVVYGNTTAATVNINSTGGIAASNGFRIAATSGSFGYSVSGVGDVNGDGLADVLVGPIQNVGYAYVVYGNASGTTVNISSNGSINVSNGFKVTGSSTGYFAYSLSGAGDINGDGLSDLIMGSLGNGYSLVLSGTQWVTSAVTGTGTVTGGTGAEAIVGSAAADTLTGGGGVDRFFAGQGNDTIVLTASDVTNLANNATGQTVKAMVSGGGGFDTLRLTGSANLNLTTISNAGGMGLEENSRIESIERIDLATDTTANALVLAAKDVKDMAGFNLFHTGSASADGKTWTNVSGTALSANTAFHQLQVDGGNTDSLVLNTHLGVWTNAGTVNNGTSNYTVYQNTATDTQVLVQAGVSVVNAPVMLAASNPVAGGYLNALGNNLTLTFDQAVLKGTGTIQLFNSATGALVEGFDVASSTLVTGWGSNTLAINPTADLTTSTRYYLRVTDNAVQNAVGSTFAGIADAMSYRFSTAATDGSVAASVNALQVNTSLVGVTSAGDVNGDGFDDYLVNVGSTNTAYVIYGNATGTPSDLSAATIAASKGFKITTNATMWASGGGDFNGDGLADLLVTSNGNTFVVYGSSNAAYTGVNLSSATPSIASSLGYQIATGGQVVSGAGDVNGDGFADFITGDARGNIKVVYGAASGVTPSVTGFSITAQNASSTLAPYSVSGAGDVNGDGLADILVGSYGNNKAFVIYGKSATGQSLNLSTGNPASSAGFTISYASGVGENLGFQVSSAGDVNGDGLADFLVATSNSGSGPRSAYVVYGNSTGSNVSITPGSIAASNGFVISGPTGIGFSPFLSSAGDVNGDGLADVIVSSRFGDPGAAYVVYGNASGTAVSVTNGSIAASQGFKVTGETYGYFAANVSNAGDINGDGLADLIVGGYGAGASYSVILGGTQWVSNAVSGGGTVTGTSAGEALIGSAIADTLTGGGGVDRFFAGMGNDTIVLTASDITNLASNTAGQTAKENVSGGNGFDTIRLSGGAALDLTTISNVGAMGLEENSRIESIERIDMTTDTAVNKLILMARDVKDMAGFDAIRTGSVSDDGNTWTNVTGSALNAITKYHQVVVDGTSADAVIFAADLGFWANAGTASNGTTTYTIYQNTGTNSQVLVSSDVVVTNNDATPDVVLTGLVI